MSCCVRLDLFVILNESALLNEMSNLGGMSARYCLTEMHTQKPAWPAVTLPLFHPKLNPAELLCWAQFALSTNINMLPETASNQFIIISEWGGTANGSRKMRKESENDDKFIHALCGWGVGGRWWWIIMFAYESARGENSLIRIFHFSSLPFPSIEVFFCAWFNEWLLKIEFISMRPPGWPPQLVPPSHNSIYIYMIQQNVNDNERK